MPMSTLRSPVSSAAGIALSLMLLSATAGCGLSHDYQQRTLEGASDAQLCYAATDPRVGGYEVRARVAGDLIAERGISCDYATEAQLHAGQAAAQQMGIRNSLDMIGTGVRLMQPPPVTTCTGSIDEYTCTRIR